MTRMAGPDCAVMCNLINIHTYLQNNYKNMYIIDTYIHTYLGGACPVGDEQGTLL